MSGRPVVMPEKMLMEVKHLLIDPIWLMRLSHQVNFQHC